MSKTNAQKLAQIAQHKIRNAAQDGIEQFFIKTWGAGTETTSTDDGHLFVRVALGDGTDAYYRVSVTRLRSTASQP